MGGTMKLRLLTVFIAVVGLLLSACTGTTPRDPNFWEGQVGQGEVRGQAGRAAVIFPDGVAPAGTRATVRVKQAGEQAYPRAVALSETIEVALDGGLQPAVPVTLVLPVQPNAVPAASLEKYLLFVSGVSADGTERFATGTLDAAGGTFTVKVDHFSDFKLWAIDLGAVLDEVRTAIIQSIGLEHPAPGCVGKSATVEGTKYDVASLPGAHLCVEERNGSLVVSAHPAIAMPYRITSKPSVTGTTSATEATIGTAGLIALAGTLRLIGKGSQAAVFPGASASYTFKGAPRSVELDLEQYPVLLLMAILAKTADTLGLGTVEDLADLQCLADIGTMGKKLSSGIDGEGVATVTKSFFSCVDRMANLNPFHKFLVAALSAAPSFLVTAVLGIINEFTGQARQHVALTVTPLRMTDKQLLNAELPAHVCVAADGDGWDSDRTIQLKDGRGIAKAADGSFDGVSVMETKVLGRADLDGNGKTELVLSLVCSGSPPEHCCAGQSSIMQTVVVFTESGGKLTRVAPSLMGGATPPGDQFGPANRKIMAASLRGTTVVTKEIVLYAHMYTPAQLGGDDPGAEVTVEYKLKNGSWTPSRP